MKFKLRKQEKLSKSNSDMKCRLRLAKTFSDSPMRNHLLGKVNSVTLDFIASPVKIQKRKLQGRRYSINDKITALSIYKTSPKGYKFLSTLFALPSKKTLTNLLSHVPFQADINYILLNI